MRKEKQLLTMTHAGSVNQASSEFGSRHGMAGVHVMMTGVHVMMTGVHVMMTGMHVMMTGVHVMMTGRREVSLQGGQLQWQRGRASQCRREEGPAMHECE